MKKSIIGTYWEPWEWDTLWDSKWEPGLWIVYAIEDEPDKLIIQHEDADDDWGMALIIPSTSNILLADDPVRAALHFNYAQKGIWAHSGVIAKWWLWGVLQSSRDSLQSLGRSVANWTVDYFIPFLISMFGVVAFPISLIGALGNPEFLVFYAALLAASIWALNQWPDWLTDFLTTVFGWVVIIAILYFLGFSLMQLWQSL